MGYESAGYRLNLSGILRDLRYSAYSLAQTPGAALALLLSIAVGLGSNATILGFARGLVAKDAPVPEESGIVSLFRIDAHGGLGPISHDDYVQLKGRASDIEWIGGARVSQSVMKIGGQSTIVSVAEVTPEIAALFHLSLEGREIVSRRLWELGFRGERVDRAPDTLEGVYSDRPVDVWRLLREESLVGRDRSSKTLWALAKLRQGVRTSDFGTEIRILPYTGMTPERGQGLRRVGTLLRMATGLVFFIACVNAASFLLGRATSRSRMNCIRVALGASPGRLVRSVFSDSVVVSLAGAALGVLLAMWTSQIVPALLFEQDAELLVLKPGIAGIIAASAVGATVVIVCGLLPLLQIQQVRPAAVLASEAAGPSKSARIVRGGLVITQMACCCVLVICTGALYAGFQAALRTNASRDAGRPVLATVQAHPDVSVDLGYFRNTERAVRALSGVSGVNWAARLPGSRPAFQSFRIEPRELPMREVRMDTAGLTANALFQFTWPPKAGRSFGRRDQGCTTAIVNEEAAQALFGDDTPGRMIRDGTGGEIEIVGVVEERGRPRPTMYYDNVSHPGPPMARIAGARFGVPTEASLARVELNTNVVSHRYFAAMGFARVAGQTFADATGAQGCRVAVVNQEAADLYFGKDAVGAAIIDELSQRTRIVGVVHAAQLGTFERQGGPTVYFPMAQDSLQAMTMIIATQSADAPMLAKVESVLEGVPGRGPAPIVVKTMETHLRQTALAPLFIATALVGSCAVAGLLLSVLGLYGALSDLERTRRRDMAMRLALGARTRDVIGQFLGAGGKLAGIGAVVGVVGSFVLSRWLSRMASGPVEPRLWAWVAGPLVLAGAVVVASIQPARRAMMLDPLRILRGE